MALTAIMVIVLIFLGFTVPASIQRHMVLWAVPQEHVHQLLAIQRNVFAQWIRDAMPALPAPQAYALPPGSAGFTGAVVVVGGKVAAVPSPWERPTSWSTNHAFPRSTSPPRL